MRSTCSTGSMVAFSIGSSTLLESPTGWRSAMMKDCSYLFSMWENFVVSLSVRRFSNRMGNLEKKDDGRSRKRREGDKNVSKGGDGPICAFTRVPVRCSVSRRVNHLSLQLQCKFGCSIPTRAHGLQGGERLEDVSFVCV